ncbi:MAG: response regulator [Pseudomonadota bacterium]
MGRSVSKTDLAASLAVETPADPDCEQAFSKAGRRAIDQTVYVVDDDDAIRSALTLLLESVNLKCLALASAQQFLDVYDGRPGVLVLDVRMPEMSGLELQRELMTRDYRQLALIFMSGHGDIPMAVEALKLGAVDFLPKPFRDQDLLHRVNEALEQNRAGHESALEADEVNRRIDSLTPRERQVMALIADGQANKSIGVELGISPRTVEIHRSHAMEKMSVRSVAQLVRMLDRVGFFGEARNRIALA